MLRRWVDHLLKHHKFKFKQWIDLEDRKIEIAGASDKDKDEFPQLVVDFLSDALPIIPKWIWARMRGVDTLEFYFQVASSLRPKRYLPLINLPHETEQPNTPSWDYQGRNWYFYAHLLADKFGWTLDYIATLDVFDAMAMVEEVLLNDQLEREFTWSMSEASISYDPNTKTSKPIPLPRPYWMTTAAPDAPIPIQKINIPKHMLPVGLVNYDSLPTELHPKEVDAGGDVAATPDTESGGTDG